MAATNDFKKSLMPDDLLKVVKQTGFTSMAEWKLPAWMLRSNVLLCRRCGKTYVEGENLGMFKCTQHAYHFPFNRPEGERWPCCGAIIKKDMLTDEGCVLADHTVSRSPWTFSDDYYMPKNLYVDLKIDLPGTPNPGALVDYNQYVKDLKMGGAPEPQDLKDRPDNIKGSMVYIRRFDFARHMRNNSRAQLALHPVKLQKGIK